MSARKPWEEASEEWWALVDPKTDRWARITKEEAWQFSVVECRPSYAFTDKIVIDLAEVPK